MPVVGSRVIGRCSEGSAKLAYGSNRLQLQWQRFCAAGCELQHSIPFNSPLPALVSTCFLCTSDTFSLTLFDEAALHLSDHAQDREYQVPHLASGSDMWIENGDERLALLTLVYDVQHSAKAGRHQRLRGKKPILMSTFGGMQTVCFLA